MTRGRVRRRVSLTHDVTVGEFERFESVETGEGDQVETAVHRVVHTHHPHIPASRQQDMAHSKRVSNVSRVVSIADLTTIGLKKSSCQERQRCSERSTTITQCSLSRET